MNYRISSYVTHWHNGNNATINLYNDDNNPPTQVGIVEMSIRKGEAYIWNLHIDPEHRGNGFGKLLMERAFLLAKDHGCAQVTLEWNIKDSMKWVRDWYISLGFGLKEFGRGSVLLEKTLKGGLQDLFKPDVDTDKTCLNVLKLAKTCKHRQRWECNSKVFQYCGVRKSNRTSNGHLKIKCKQPACGLYQQKGGEE